MAAFIRDAEPGWRNKCKVTDSNRSKSAKMGRLTFWTLTIPTAADKNTKNVSSQIHLETSKWRDNREG